MLCFEREGTMKKSTTKFDSRITLMLILFMLLASSCSGFGKTPATTQTSDQPEDTPVEQVPAATATPQAFHNPELEPIETSPLPTEDPANQDPGVFSILPYSSQSELSNAGPWAIISDEEGIIWIMNQDGTGLQRLIKGEITGVTDWVDFKISPDGKRIVYIEMDDPDTTDTHNGYIKILTLPDGEEEVVIPLMNEKLSADEKFDIQGYVELAWAPDSSRLAFIAATEGPTSDVYVYEVSNKSINRLTDGDTQTWNLSWSPDSKIIVHVAGEKGNFVAKSIEGVWAAKADGSGNWLLYTPQMDPMDETVPEYTLGNRDETIVTWVSTNEFLVMSFYQDFRDTRLRMVNIETGDVTLLTNDPIASIAVAPSYKLALVYVCSFETSESARNGLYLLSFDGLRKQFLYEHSDIENNILLSWQPEMDSFIAISDIPAVNLQISPTGILSESPFPDDEFPQFSPSGDLWVQSRADGLWLGEGTQSIEKIMKGKVLHSSWSPNGDYLLFAAEGAQTYLRDFYAAAAPDFEPVLIATGFVYGNYCGYWENCLLWAKP